MHLCIAIVSALLEFGWKRSFCISGQDRLVVVVVVVVAQVEVVVVVDLSG